MALVKAKVSSVVPKQVPEFVREDNTQFIAFLEAYYEFLEQTEKRNLESTRDIDDTLDTFVQYFRNELLAQVPISALSDKRFLAKQINDVYRSKGTIKSYEFLFRILFNETPELYFPKTDMLRVSDGKWDQRVVIRTIETTGNAFNLIGQTIYQGSTRAIVESVIKFNAGEDLVSEITLNENSIVGTFDAALPVTGTDNIDGSPINLNVLSVITGFNVMNEGAYYSVGSPVSLISGTGTGALSQVTNIGSGYVDQIVIDAPGSGYRIGSELIFNNTDAGDYSNSVISARAVITDVNLDSIVMEDGSYLLQENRSQFDIETATTGGIKAIELLTGGFFYKKLPIVTATGGTGARLIALGQNIGRVTKIGVTNPGINYNTPPIAVFPVNIIVKNINGSFLVGDQLSALTQTMSLETDVDSELLLESGDKIIFEDQQNPIGTIYSIDTDRNLITLYPTTDKIAFKLEDDSGYLITEDEQTFVNESSGEFKMHQTVTNSGGATAKIISDTNVHAEAVGIIGAVGKTLGRFINADGKISESSKRIQDSLFYQEYSYVVKVGQSIDKYRDAVKKLLHPIGLALFGEVRVQSTINSPTAITAEFSELLKTIRQFITMKMRAVGNVHIGNEDNINLAKEQVTLIITDFLTSHVNVDTLPSEFLPVLHLPELTPTEVHLLDLRAAVGETYKDIILSLKTSALMTKKPTTLVLQERSKPTVGTRQFGPSLDWLEKWKFTIAPYAAGSKNSIGVYTDAWNQPYTDTNNEGYWDSYANTQIKDFADVIIGDVINNRNRKTNYANEAYVDIIKTS